MNRDIHSIIAREYERRQKVATDIVDQRKEQVYTKIPELYKIEAMINQFGIKYNRLILSESGDKKFILEELTEKIRELSNARNKLLVKNNISTDFFKPPYQCEKCKDTGYITDTSGSQRCSCYRQQIISHLFSQSNISVNGNECFDNFNEMLYPDEIDEAKYGITISPRENINSIKESCIKFIKNIDDPNQKNLFFNGRTGVGKTFLSFCIARELINQGRTVLYLTAPALFDIITGHKMRTFKEDDFIDDRYQSIFSVELLIIDDLGTEPLSDARYAELLNILNSRQSQSSVRTCKTIISTNIGPKKLYELYTERITSRIVGYFDRLVLAGKDIRLLQ
ncbi:ATP-binding protein [Ruminiclostridium cellulolyticum]|uniref:IstB domain protein ATP-binding protein n=1 Tax=Ruminiclostridium cellulolyticum (strain ATCC 35319 / DSM 5812 / JCM 6584 / H10) TaxID=394503 RepID=B8I3V2_RUMCH|nr:ATP-binding protein [Ruminiclostridium cellulolyticum]ACL74429.1 IstB domain protein ATP-binding protein [Ruminiclostridium cellulolyticum H10]